MTTHTVPPALPTLRLATARPTRTPDRGRDRYIDLLRAMSILAVVVGHWLVAGVVVNDGTLTAVNALGPVAALRPITWLFQVMPLFFIAGGVANAGSLGRAWRSGESSATWVAARLKRLSIPALWFVGLWSLGASVALAVGVDARHVDDASRWSMIQLWFLATYVMIVALAPFTLRLYRRLGNTALIGGMAAVALIDVAARSTGVEAIGWANAVLVWTVCQMVGFAWAAGRLPTSARFWSAGLVVAMAVAAALVGIAGYSVSLVGVPGEARPNTAPPTVMLVVAMSAQLCVVKMAERRVRARLERSTASTGGVPIIDLLNARAMTVYLWHMTAMVGLASAAWGLGVLPDATVGSARWWAVKPVWIALSAIVVVGFSWVLLPVEKAALMRGGTTRFPANPMAVAVGTGLFAVGFARLTTGHLVSGTTLDPLTLGALVAASVVTFGSLRRRVSS